MSVRLSVCPSQAAIVLKWLNVGSRKQHHMIAQRHWLFNAKDFGKIPNPMGSPNGGAKYRWLKSTILN